MKILLIEDRVEKRQQKLLKKYETNLDEYEDILKQVEKEEELQEENLSNYNMIICHKTAFDGNFTNVIKDNALKNKIPLVFFSGEIDNSSYQNIDYEFCQVNDELFYKNIKLFLDDVKNDNLNVLILSYGKLWKLNILCNVLEKLNILIEKNRDEKFIDYGDVTLKINFDSISKVYDHYYQVVIEDDETTIEELLKLKDDLSNTIRKFVNE